MGTLRDYFDTDLPRALNSRRTRYFHTTDGKSHEVVEKTYADFEANAKYISYFMPPDCDAEIVCSYVIENPQLALSVFDEIFIGTEYLTDQPHSVKDLVFTEQILFYVDGYLKSETRKALLDKAAERGLYIQIRDKSYADEIAKIEKPQAFISHDARDKDVYARQLAQELGRLMVPVWYDEYSLKVGDGLRESIEKGIKECKKCILILTPNYLSNPGWTKAEFNSIFTREILESKNIVLPIWAGVSKKAVYDYSPSLANKIALLWSDDVKGIAGKLKRAIDSE